MPILGVTDQETVLNFRPRRPEIGRLHKGSEKGTSKRGNWKGGDNLDYWRFTSDDPEVVEAFKEIYGEKPTALRVYFLDDRPEDVFDTFTGMKDGGGRLLWKGDGVHVFGRLDTTTKKWQRLSGTEVTHPAEYKEYGRLEVVLSDFADLGIRGVVRLNSSSRYDIRAVTTELFDAFRKYGTLRKIPFLLFRADGTVTSPDGKRRTESLVHVCPAEDYEAVMVELINSNESEDGAEDEFTELENLDLDEVDEIETLIGKPSTPAKPTLSEKTHYVAPADLNELWGGKRWQDLGYQAVQHAQNVVKKHCAKGADVGAIWKALVEHAPAKESDAERQAILQEINDDGGNPEEVPEFPNEDDVPF